MADRNHKRNLFTAVALALGLVVGSGGVAAANYHPKASEHLPQLVLNSHCTADQLRRSPNTSIALTWNANSSNEVAIASVEISEPLILVPGDQAQQYLCVATYSNNATSGTLKVSLIDIDFSGAQADEGFDLITVNGIPLSDVKQSEPVVHVQEVTAGAVTEIPLTWAMSSRTGSTKLESNTNSQIGSDLTAKFTIQLEVSSIR